MDNLKQAIGFFWRQACEYDGVDPDSKFVEFSKDNPYAERYNDLMCELMERMNSVSVS